MSSSTSSSDVGRGVGGRAFVVIALLCLALLLASLGWAVGIASGTLKGTSASNYVLSVLRDPGTDVIVGDSHLLPIGTPEGWLNLSRSGLPPAEAARVLAARLKLFGLGRVVIESGPQMLMELRQADYRSLPPQTLTRQIFPEPVLMLEPALLTAFLDRLRSGVGNVVSRAAAAERQRGMRNDDMRRPAVRRRIELQQPVAGYRDSAAWRYHWDIIQRLADAGVDVCLVQAPVSPAYIGIVRELDRAPYFPALRAMQREALRRDIRFVAASDLPVTFGNPAFKNVDHLTKRGAKRFWNAAFAACFPDA